MRNGRDELAKREIPKTDNCNMSGTFYKRLKSYYQTIGEILHHQAEISAVYPNPTDKGYFRETIYSEFLKNHLPSSCNIVLGGFLFDLNGNESKQLDVIVTNSTCLRYRLPVNHIIKEFACTEGSLAVISVKSDLDSRGLIDTLDNLASIPPNQSLEGRVSPLMSIPNYADWPYKIVYAHKGTSIEALHQSLNKFYLERTSIPITRRPNLIHVNRKGCIIRIPPGGGKLRNGDMVPEHTFHPMNDPTNAYALMCAIQNIQLNSIASNHIIFNYNSMLDQISFD